AHARRRPGVQGARRPDTPAPARPPVPARRPHADGARVGAVDDSVRGHEAPAGPRAGGPRGHAALGSGEAPLPQPRAHPDDPRPLDRQVHGAPGLGAPRPQGRTGGTGMASATGTGVTTTQVHEIYIRATPEAI